MGHHNDSTGSPQKHGSTSDTVAQGPKGPRRKLPVLIKTKPDTVTTLICHPLLVKAADAQVKLGEGVMNPTSQ